MVRRLWALCEDWVLGKKKRKKSDKYRDVKAAKRVRLEVFGSFGRPELSFPLRVLNIKATFQLLGYALT